MPKKLFYIIVPLVWIISTLAGKDFVFAGEPQTYIEKRIERIGDILIYQNHPYEHFTATANISRGIAGITIGFK